MSSGERSVEGRGYDQEYFKRPYFADHPGKRRSSAHVVRQLQRCGLEAGDVLDIGSGPGYLLRSLLEAGYRASGMDHAEVALDLAASHEAGVDLRLADVCERIPWEDESFDGVVLHDVIEHLPEARAALLEVHRVLRPGGIVLVSTLNGKSVLHALLGRRWSFYQDPTHVQLYDRRSLEALLRQTGLEPVRAWTYFDFNAAGETTRWMKPLRRFAFVLNVPYFGESITVVARRPSGGGLATD